MFLGIVILIYTLFALSKSKFVLSEKMASWLALPTGFTTGFVNGVSGSQIMPILPYLLSLKLEKNLFVQALNISFTLSSLVMLIGLGRYGLLSQATLVLALIGIVSVAIGTQLGGIVRGLVTDEFFRKLVLWFLIAIALILIMRVLI